MKSNGAADAGPGWSTVKGGRLELEGNEAQVRQARAQIGAQAQDQMLDARLPHHYLNRRRLST